MFTTSETSIISLIVLVLSVYWVGDFIVLAFWQTGNLSLVTIGGVDNSLAVIFGLFAVGIYINIVGILFLLVASAGFTSGCNRLRAAGQDAVLRGRATERLANSTQSKSSQEENTASAS